MLKSWRIFSLSLEYHSFPQTEEIKSEHKPAFVLCGICLIKFDKELSDGVPGYILSLYSNDVISNRLDVVWMSWYFVF